MVDYLPFRSNNWKLHELEPDSEEDQEEPQAQVDIVWNVLTEKGDAKSLALKISLRLPLKS
jgi:hypothetical protein